MKCREKRVLATFHVISRKFGLLFGQCIVLCTVLTTAYVVNFTNDVINILSVVNFTKAVVCILYVVQFMNVLQC